MLRYRLVLPLLAFVASACITSESGQPPEPDISVPLSASEAGLAALSSESLNPETCQGVLGSPPGTHTLELQALTDTAQAGVQEIDSMCAAVYETPVPGDPFLTVALIKFKTDGPAIDHYELLKEVFVTQGQPISEVNSADDRLLDRFSALLDRDGIGRTTVLRQNSWILTVSVGPTTADSLWTSDDVQLIGESIIGRAQE